MASCGVRSSNWVKGIDLSNAISMHVQPFAGSAASQPTPLKTDRDGETEGENEMEQNNAWEKPGD